MLAQLKNILVFVLDVDGVLTDGTLLVMPNGVLIRKMNIKDGYALQLAILSMIISIKILMRLISQKKWWLIAL